MKTQYLLLCIFVSSIAVQATNLIDESLKAFPPGSIDRIATPPNLESYSTAEVSYSEFTPSESTLEITKLLKAIQDKKSNPAIMPGSQAPTLEELLVVELAHEVIRMKEENRKLTLQVEALSKK